MTNYIWINKKKVTTTELECMSLERLSEIKSVKQKEILGIQKRIDSIQEIPEMKETVKLLNHRIRVIQLGISEINRIVKNKNRENKSHENKLCYRFFTHAKEILPAETFDEIVKAAKEEMILKGEFIVPDL